jgi:hypothetical protein
MEGLRFIGWFGTEINIFEKTFSIENERDKPKRR